MHKVPRLLLIGAFLCALSACDEGAVSEPGSLEPFSHLVGEWHGTIGDGSFELVFFSTNKSLYGTVTLDLGDGMSRYEFDKVEWLSPTEFRIKLPCRQVCDRFLIGTTLDDHTLQGSYHQEFTIPGDENIYQEWSAAKKTENPLDHRVN